LRNDLETYTFEDFQNAVKKSHWFVTGRSIWFIIGNLSKQSSLEIADKGRSLLIGGKEREKFVKADLCSVRPISLKAGEWYRIEQPLDDKDNENNCQVTYFEAGAFSKSNLYIKMIH
jgi:hypothetical protein